jgi:hypothetical protein
MVSFGYDCLRLGIPEDLIQLDTAVFHLGQDRHRPDLEQREKSCDEVGGVVQEKRNEMSSLNSPGLELSRAIGDTVLKLLRAGCADPLHLIHLQETGVFSPVAERSG